MASRSATADLYALLGLARSCSAREIRDAYRLLARRFHPDLNPNNPESSAQLQSLNAAYEVLSDPVRRRAYDRELDQASQEAAPKRAARIDPNIKQEVRLRIEDFLQGTVINVTVRDPAHPEGAEEYRVTIPAMTAPGTRLRVPRTGAAAKGHVLLQLKALPGYRFKARGADLRTDLRISPRRAEEGGTEMVEGPSGSMFRLTIPRRVGRGELLRISGEGLPKPRGGRGDLLVRITYRPDVRVTYSR